MSVMQPTTQLRWNETPKEKVSTNLFGLGPPYAMLSKSRRLEQLWIETAVAGETALGRGYAITEPKKEWRPIDLVKIGWENDKYAQPLQYTGS